jgi:hypothetical protein
LIFLGNLQLLMQRLVLHKLCIDGAQVRESDFDLVESRDTADAIKPRVVDL